MQKIDNMFFEFKYAKLSEESFKISSESTVLCSDAGYAEDYIKNILAGLDKDGRCMNIKLETELTSTAKDAAGDVYCENDESYAVEIFDNEIVLSAVTKGGLIFAVSTLLQLIESGNLKKGVIFDYPDKKLRGYRAFTPGKKSLESFKKVIDMLVYYKYNHIILEVGGAMEYKPRPEINKKWIEFCKEVHQSPYEAERIQFKTHPQWSKNAIHADNGDGSYISQEEMRAIISYCNERGLTVIPEVPSLCHCDYIVMAFPEINERVEDTYPDTYCPSNPKSYEILFDILDEVIDVFNPKIINIGHDEAYTLAQCPKCKDKDPVDLYVGDIVKINNYLKSKNIKSLMWCEKLLGSTHVVDGNPVGGAANPEKGIPALYPCREKLPHDVLMMNWYWSICNEEEEKMIQDMGFKMIYGNFFSSELNHYRDRINRVDGAFVSNWGSFDELYMQRNYQNFMIVSTAFTCWNDEYDTPAKEFLMQKTHNELYKNHLKTTGVNPIEITHTTNLKIEHKKFYDGYTAVDNEWLMGYYKVKYEQGFETKLPVLYGYNICFEEYDPTNDLLITEAIGASVAFKKNGKTYYKAAFNNPYPDLKIESIYFEKAGEFDKDSYEVVTI